MVLKEEFGMAPRLLFWETRCREGRPINEGQASSIHTSDRVTRLYSRTLSWRVCIYKLIAIQTPAEVSLPLKIWVRS